MKGLVPVTKQSLLVMAANCREEIARQETETREARIAKYIADEKERITMRRWYRLFILPKCRFLFFPDCVIEFSGKQRYEMFSDCPFKILEKDVENSIVWIKRLEIVANSQYSGEPIQIDMNDFLRLSNPTNYYWARVGMSFSVRTW